MGKHGSERNNVNKAVAETGDARRGSAEGKIITNRILLPSLLIYSSCCLSCFFTKYPASQWQ